MTPHHTQLLINGQPPSGNTYFTWLGGIGVFSACATNFNGATVTLQFVGPDGTTLITCGTNTTFTANGANVFYLHPCKIVATVTGGTPTGLYAAADRVPE